MEGNQIRVNMQKGKQRENTGNTKRDIHDQHRESI